MNGGRLSGMPARLSVLGMLGLTILITACGQPGAAPEQSKKPVAAKKHQQECANDLGVAVEITNSIGMKLVLIPPGRFMMGSPKSEEHRGDGEHQRRVRIERPFYLGAYEVTQEEYEQVMGVNPSKYAAGKSGEKKVSGMDTSRFPVESVSWNNAVEFCEKLSALPAETSAGRVYRLPREAEWEYACRAGTTTPFYFGSQLDIREANYTDTNGPQLLRTTAVGSYQPNAFGLYDMHGNVWEWCQDRYDTGLARVLRGGSFSLHPWGCRSAARWRDDPGDPSPTYGFRVAVFPPRK